MFGRPTKCSNEPASIIRGSLHWLSKAESVHTHTHARTHTHTHTVSGQRGHAASFCAGASYVLTKAPTAHEGSP